jgi:hypothetical protein
MRKDEARGEEATQMRTQQQCILNGGVYLHHHFGKASLPKKSACSAFPTPGYYTSPIASVQHAACWRAGVQETVPLSHSQKNNTNHYNIRAYPIYYPKLLKLRKCLIPMKPALSKTIPDNHKINTKVSPYFKYS